MSVANQLRFRVDSLTTGALFGGEAITRYSIGGRLVEYTQTPLALVSNTAMPALTRLQATDERDKMSRSFCSCSGSIWWSRSSLPAW